MRCTKCNHKFSKIELSDLQEGKEDYWLCICGDFHKGFPYSCPLTAIRQSLGQYWFSKDLRLKEIERILDEYQSKRK
jgi:hypothetical protein